MHQNVRSVGSESFQSPVNVVPLQNEHYATPPHIPAGRVAVRPTCIHQNSRSVDTEAGECLALAERTLRYPTAYARRKGCGKTIPHASERKVGGFRILPKSGECRALAKRTLRHSAAYTGRTGRSKTILHSSERKVGRYRVLV
ncbi:hypothetical protein TNCT_574831 [Trichonephila clavata]|uniref:Uncharacterized protein n=1 Tax=Trichonephila clavata TaxID=2740835 RepID=A0A8X6K6P7_TRICU|nr:hypothetical protein TNCT_574831 [Trichonephila clavata]